MAATPSSVARNATEGIPYRNLTLEFSREDNSLHVLRRRLKKDLEVLKSQPHFHEVLFVDRALVRAALEGHELFANVVLLQLANGVGDEVRHVGPDEYGGVVRSFQ